MNSGNNVNEGLKRVQRSSCERVLIVWIWRVKSCLPLPKTWLIRGAMYLEFVFVQLHAAALRLSRVTLFGEFVEPTNQLVNHRYYRVPVGRVTTVPRQSFLFVTKRTIYSTRKLTHEYRVISHAVFLLARASAAKGVWSIAWSLPWAVLWV